MEGYSTSTDWKTQYSSSLQINPQSQCNPTKTLKKKKKNCKEIEKLILKFLRKQTEEQTSQGHHEEAQSWRLPPPGNGPIIKI